MNEPPHADFLLGEWTVCPALNRLMRGPDEVRLEWWAAALVLAAYAALLAGFGIWRTTRADIT